MPRKGPVTRRPVVNDAKYGDHKVSVVINKVMLDGKKNIAESIVYEAMDIAAQKTGAEALAVLHQALEAVRPQVEVKSRRVGGATYQVPIEVSDRRQQSLAVRWLVEFSRKRSEHTMAERLGNEIADSVNERGGAFKKRDETHRMAEANKAFSHFRW
ncbi:30S ribosomal protein S7 [Mariprofundus ferrooxydans]|jgi:small subunit ribosomal protein S7|uniref:Small ribosomal subunit protein uS7 n=1 Tax=Mariprofundus ferrooxydans PV-1 TaxID=314345 RepID=Q0EW32_9PROT|nr:30S ribosomal protein S7 [Mariprofundus ferrooxydans]EAU53523.1 30S ribosomal protein S7 [Mariprofundus ferrooxydans PV-1]KON47493.1 30S ribosomal protein S7 [Mariprofundus ferrooxydans]